MTNKKKIEQFEKRLKSVYDLSIELATIEVIEKDSDEGRIKSEQVRALAEKAEMEILIAYISASVKMSILQM